MLCGSVIYTAQFDMIKPELRSGQRQWILIYAKHLKRLICLGYWRTKHWRFLVWENEAKQIWWDQSLRSWQGKSIYFINPKIGNKAFG